MIQAKIKIDGREKTHEFFDEDTLMQYLLELEANGIEYECNICDLEHRKHA